MRKRWFLVGVMFLLVPWLLTGCGIPQEQYDATTAELNTAKQELQSVKAELGTTQAKVSELTSNLGKAENRPIDRNHRCFVCSTGRFRWWMDVFRQLFPYCPCCKQSSDVRQGDSGDTRHQDRCSCVAGMHGQHQDILLRSVICESQRCASDNAQVIGNLFAGVE